MFRAFIVFAVLATGLLFAPASAAERPNVIVVMSDDQGYGDLSCHGNPVVRTPNLDRLYAESLRMTDFHVAPMCTPTRGQLLTGLDAFRNGAMNVSSGRTLLRRGLPTMADVFAASGYRTGIFGKWHLGDNYPYRPQDRGFHEAVWFPSSHINSVPDYWNNDYFDDTYYHNGEREKYEGYCTDVFFREAIAWMKREAEAGKPFFTYLPLNAPHGPLFVPDRYRQPVRERLAAAEAKLPELEPGRRASLVSFLAMIENLDENLGRLESFLADGGLKQNTLLVFLTDNGSTTGPSYYNAGMKGGKVTLWEGGHRVPLFVRWPEGEFGPPRDIAELAHVQDLLPTLIDACGLEKVVGTSVPTSKDNGVLPGESSRDVGTKVPTTLEQPGETKFDGVSLAGLWRGTEKTLADRMLVVNYSRMPFGVNRPTADHPGTPRKEGAAVMWRRWRLLEDKMLFDLATDPQQERNVIDEHPEVAAKMREHLNAWWNGVKDTVNEPSRVVIGAEAENPTMLTACEWFDVFVDQQRQVRAADPKVGVWHLEVARGGEYTIELRRYPREAGLAIGQGIPVTRVVDGQFIAGRELPVARARLKIGGHEEAIDLEKDAASATFRVALESGPVELETCFYDAQGNEICGAYFAYVQRTGASR